MRRVSDAEGLRSTFDSTAGGVMTEEAGAVTGELELETRIEGGTLTASVRYAGAEEWYSVAGGPVRLPGDPAPSHAELHDGVVERLSRPGRVVDGNERPVLLPGADEGGTPP